MGDLKLENLVAIIDLLDYSQWDYNLVGQSLLPSVKGSELGRWIKENSMDYPVDVVVTDGIPERLMQRGGQGRAGRWEWLRRMIVEDMGPQARKAGKSITRRVTLPNRKDMKSAQSSATGVKYSPGPRAAGRTLNVCFKEPGHSIITRSESLTDSGNGEYHLYIEVAYTPQRHLL